MADRRRSRVYPSIPINSSIGQANFQSQQNMPSPSTASSSQDYWEAVATEYQAVTRIAEDDFHFGPLVPGDRNLKILPPLEPGDRCLELGCGGGQNSIHLARQGARCTAVDISNRQLEHGRRLAAGHCLEIEFVQADLDNWLPPFPAGSFDLVHSSYTLPFLHHPRQVVARACRLLRPGGWLILSTAHPLAHAEPIELSETKRGVFLQNYFKPPVERAEQLDGQGIWQTETCQPRPIAEVAAWILDNGLWLRDLREPRPLPPSALRQSPPPYDSDRWRENLEHLRYIPIVIVFAASKTEEDRI